MPNIDEEAIVKKGRHRRNGKSLTGTEAGKLLFLFAPRWAINLVGQSSSNLRLRKQYLSICNKSQRNNVSFSFQTDGFSLFHGCCCARSLVLCNMYALVRASSDRCIRARKTRKERDMVCERIWRVWHCSFHFVISCCDVCALIGAVSFVFSRQNDNKNNNNECNQDPDEAVANTTNQIENEMDVVCGLTIEQSPSRHVQRKPLRIFLRTATQRRNKSFFFLKFSSSNNGLNGNEQRRKNTK